ncbi:PIN domain-containing protein [Candidatus Viridilinea mediisalina]|uniref:PIN domain nuclease n=1 Tax=Candidatus Viridilinea mediisalina TaxID=2024553 RepID=A0A2A6RDD8_9CHLR|nr:PIN domain-containing protein [Candidatus Viridilinea mediisalina]PDV99141.1 PIN domain nuclease [Candidatus Viridilinea mediisalina]
MHDSEQLQFIDTNILIYAHDRSAGVKHQQARDLIATLWQHGNGCLSIQVLQEFYVNVTRKVAHPLSPENASQIIADLSNWTVHQPNVADLLEAIRIQQRFQLSFWDAMILVSALRLDCHTLWSEDLNSGQQYEQLRVLNPFALS